VQHRLTWQAPKNQPEVSHRAAGGPKAVRGQRLEVAYSVEKLGSRDRVRNAAKTDLSDRSRIDDRDLGKG